MQPLARDGLTDAQVRALLVRDDVHYKGGLELLDTSNRYVETITDDLADGSITWDNRTAVHGSCRLSLQRALVWGRDRLRPFMTVSGGDVSARFDLGIYIPTTPDEDRGEDPITYEVTCYGLLSVLQNGPADTYVVPAGTSYYDALTSIVAASGIGVPLLLDGDLADVVLPATRVWAVFSPAPSWLRMMTDLLTEVGYTAPYEDPNGAIRSRPYEDVSTRASEWTLDTTDVATNLVYDNRSAATEAGDIPNWWRFVRTDIEGTPVEGDGIYTPDPNLTDGPASQESLGRWVRKITYVQAADQASLVAQGDKIKAGDMAAARTITLPIEPLPCMGFDDVFTYVDTAATGVESVKLLAATWSLNLDGSAGQLVLGGAPREPLDEISTSARGTVTDDAPLTVVVDGATVPSFANAIDGASYELGDRVTLTIRNPLPPLIQGVES